MATEVTTTWELRSTAPFSRETGEAAIETVNSIYQQRGFVVPQDVVDAARPDDHPLHGQFEWDDSVAAEAHRRQQARHILQYFIAPRKVPEGVDPDRLERITVKPSAKREEFEELDQEVTVVYGPAFVSTKVNVGTDDEPKWKRVYLPQDVAKRQGQGRIDLMAEFVDRLARDVSYALADFPELDFLQDAVDEAKGVVERLQKEA